MDDENVRIGGSQMAVVAPQDILSGRGPSARRTSRASGNRGAATRSAQFPVDYNPATPEF